MLRNYQIRATSVSRGSGTSVSLVYLALISLSSLAFATVSLQGDSFPDTVGSASNPHPHKSDSISADEAVSEMKTVMLTNYPGEINRAGKDSVQEGKQDRFWNSLAKVWLTSEQVHLLKTAFDIGYKDGGLEHARLVQGMLLQETIAGLLGRIGHMTAPVGKRSYGVMQVKATAANDVLRKYSEFGVFSSDEELIAELIVDDEFNIRLASKHFLHLRARTKTDAQALMAYNIGLRASRRYKNHHSFRYVKKVNRYSERVVNPFNKKFNSRILSTVQQSDRLLATS